MTDPSAAYQHFRDRLGFKFKDPDSLHQALTHSSYVNELGKAVPAGDNERLEFLGDAVLDIIVADMLFRRYPTLPEGALTQLRASLVKTESLAQLARACSLGEFLRIGHGEELSGGRQRSTTLCQAFEAVICAMYLDRGLAAVKRFLEPRLLALLEHIIEHNLHIDARSELQALTQARLNIPPNYRVADSQGPEHEKEFIVEVCIGGTVLGSGAGGSKRAAAQEAARIALNSIHADGFPDVSR